MTRLTRAGRIAIASAAALALTVAAADARPGRSGSFGSRGARTYSAPPPTATAPSAVQPMQRSATQPGMQRQAPAATAATAQQPRRFGFGTGLAAGLLGAGLLGMLMGNGFFGGLGGIASLFGLLLQVGLIVGLVWLALRFFRRRQEPAAAGAGAPGGYARNGLGGGLGGGLGSGLGSGLGAGLGGGLGGARAQAAPSAAIQIGPDDYNAFERLLGEIQLAYGKEDMDTLRSRISPEMASYFAEELADNARNGLVNTIAEPKLLQGDLAEAWREGETDYATVAMRFSLIDATRERATGRVVSGNADAPTEATEVWTFRRDRGQDWKLSAIQQV